MHGLPVAQEIVNTVIRSIKERQGKVRRIQVEMGPDSTIDAQELELCFEIASQGTPIEGSTLNVSLAPGNVTCLDCGKTELRTVVERIPTCQACLGTNLRIE